MHALTGIAEFWKEFAEFGCVRGVPAACRHIHSVHRSRSVVSRPGDAQGSQHVCIIGRALPWYVCDARLYGIGIHEAMDAMICGESSGGRFSAVIRCKPIGARLFDRHGASPPHGQRALPVRMVPLCDAVCLACQHVRGGASTPEVVRALPPEPHNPGLGLRSAPRQL